MKLKGAYLPQDSIYPHLGLNAQDPETLSNPKFSPDCLNVVFRQGRITKRNGYQELGSGIGATELVLALVEFEDASATKHLVAITDKKEYHFNRGTKVWDNITYQETGADVDRTGDATNVIDWVVALGTEGKYLIFTNGKDQPRKWDGSTAKTELWAPNIANFVTCGCIAQFYDHLVIGDVTTTSRGRQQVYWSDIGELDDFLGTEAGATLVTDTVGTIRKLLPLGDKLVIYGDDSIGTANYVGGDLIYSFEQQIQQARLVSSRAIVNIGPYHLYLGSENVWLFEGTRMVRPIGDMIAPLLRKELSYENKELAQAFLDRARNHVYWVVPTSSTESTVYLLEYDVFDLNNIKWTKLSYGDQPISLGFYSRESTITWNSAEFTRPWNTLNMTWDQGSTREGFPVRVVGGTGAVYLHDDSGTIDGAGAVDGRWDSVELTVPQEYKSMLGRWGELEFEACGTSVEVLVRVDGGGDFESLGTVTLDPSVGKYKVPFDKTGRSLRVRVRNTESNGWFELRWLRTWVVPCGV